MNQDLFEAFLKSDARSKDIDFLKKVLGPIKSEQKEVLEEYGNFIRKYLMSKKRSWDHFYLSKFNIRNRAMKHAGLSSSFEEIESKLFLKLQDKDYANDLVSEVKSIYEYGLRVIEAIEKDVCGRFLISGDLYFPFIGTIYLPEEFSHNLKVNEEVPQNEFECLIDHIWGDDEVGINELRAIYKLRLPFFQNKTFSYTLIDVRDSMTNTHSLDEVIIFKKGELRKAIEFLNQDDQYSLSEGLLKEIKDVEDLVLGIKSFFSKNKKIKTFDHSLLTSIVLPVAHEYLEFESDFKLKSLSGLIGEKQPDNTCPIIDGGCKRSLESDIEEIEEECQQRINELESDKENTTHKYSQKISRLEDDISDLESQLNEMLLEEEKYDEQIDSLNCDIENLREEIEKIQTEISDAESECESEIEILEDEKKDKIRDLKDLFDYAEELRSSCEDSRNSALDTRNYIYEFVKGGCYTIKSYPGHVIFYSEEEFLPVFEQVNRFDERTLSHYYYAAIENYEKIVAWGNALSNVSIDEILDYNDILSLKQAIEDIIFWECCNTNQEGSVAS